MKKQTAELKLGKKKQSSGKRQTSKAGKGSLCPDSDMASGVLLVRPENGTAVKTIGTTEDIPREPNGRFQKGYTPHAYGVDPNKNRRVSGRRRILEVFDRVVGERDHIELLETEIRHAIEHTSMLDFYQQYILPLVPKEMVLTALGIDLNGGGDSSALDPNSVEGKIQRDHALREMFGLNQLIKDFGTPDPLDPSTEDSSEQD